MLTNRQRQALETKQRIITSTMTLLGEKDYNTISIKDICAKSSIGIGTFYHYFKSKEDVINSTSEIFDWGFENKINSKIPEDPFNALETIIWHYFKYTSLTGYQGISVLYRQQLINGSEYFTDNNRYLYRILQSEVDKCISAGIFRSELNNYEITERILKVLRGTIYDWCLHKGKYDLVEIGYNEVMLIINTMQR